MAHILAVLTGRAPGCGRGARPGVGEQPQEHSSATTTGKAGL